MLFSSAEDKLLRDLSIDVNMIGIDTLEKTFLAASRGENVNAIWKMLESDWRFRI